MNLEKVNKLEKRYAKISKKLLGLDEFGSTRLTYIRYKLKEIDLKGRIHQLLIPILEKESESFRHIAMQNHDLLKELDFELKTRTIGMSLLGYHSTNLKGSINANGVAYCKTSKTNLPIFNFLSSYQFPARLQGRIDCLGNISLETVAVQTGFLKTLPKKFNGRIETNGKDIQLEISKCETDITMSGKLFISEIVGNPFGKQNHKKEMFFTNKKKLEKLIDEYRQSNTRIKSETKNNHPKI